jgi:sulfur relay (sulfurtransferase) complex TusBCD TusD component (DsrE family)
VSYLGKLLLIIGYTPFQSERVNHSINLAKAALKQGHKVSIFLFMDGVYNMLNTQRGDLFKINSITNELDTLSQLGARIMCCKLCTEIRGVGGALKPAFVEETGVGELNDELEDTDAVVSFIGGT